MLRPSRSAEAMLSIRKVIIASRVVYLLVQGGYDVSVPELHVHLSKESAHGWHSSGVSLGVTTSALVEVVGQLLNDSRRPHHQRICDELGRRAKEVDFARRRRRLVQSDTTL